MLALGIDVGLAKKGLDVVLMDDLAIVERRPSVGLEQLSNLIRSLNPDVVAIDSPPKFGQEGRRSRLAETHLRKLGINVFSTPPIAKGAGHPFYGWMRVGFQAFQAAAEAGYPTWFGDVPVQRHALEVFPHACAVTLKGIISPARYARRKRSMRDWRRAVLAAHGVIDTEGLNTLDQVDAALAAFTGIRALGGVFSYVGDPSEGVIVLPVAAAPAERYLREPLPT